MPLRKCGVPPGPPMAAGPHDNSILTESVMTPPIRSHDVTGLKLFNTRAAKATEKIAGQGYQAIDDVTLKTLPQPPAGAVFNAEEQAKYRAYKEARRGAADYMAMEGEFARYLDDVYSAPPVEREALTDRMRDPGDRRRFRRPAALAQAARRRAFRMSASARRAAMSAGPGTGTAIQASRATSKPTAICRCSKRWVTSRP